MTRFWGTVRDERQNPLHRPADGGTIGRVITAAGVRIGWADLPAPVHRGVGDLLGSPVVEATSQSGGFSPGSADRVRTANGRRAFVKAVGTPVNVDSYAMLRRETEFTARLAAVAPAVLGSYDDGTWAALVLEDIDGRQPVTPWRTDELAATLRALRVLAEARPPVPYEGLPDAVAEYGPDFAGWDALRRDPWPALDPWATARLPQLCLLAARGAEAAAGDSVLHADVRADNVLVRRDGTAVLIDWPWARRGAGWTDVLQLLVNVELYGGHDVDALVTTELADVPAGDVTAFLVGLTGFFLDTARRPAPPGLPTVRAFQGAQGDVVLAWVKRRLGGDLVGTGH